MIYALFPLIIILASLPDVYLWFAFARGAAWWWRVALWLPVGVMAVCMLLMHTPLSANWMFHTIVLIALLVVLPKLMFVVVSGLGYGLRSALPWVWRVANGVGVACAVASLAMVVYGLGWGWRRFTVREVTVPVAGLPPAFEGYRIVQISDLHLGTYAMAPECVERIVREANARHPDAVCFTGDIVNSRPEEIDRFLPALSRLTARDGIYSIMGNHDYCEYARFTARGPWLRAIRGVHERERRLGWRLLLNGHAEIRRGGDTLTIVGVENVSKPPFKSYGRLDKALAGVRTRCAILLTHDPWHWRHGVVGATDVPLTLSGHTHSAQLKLFGWSPIALRYSEYDGLYREGRQRLFVSTGAGGNIAFRFGAWPEIVVLRLTAE